MNHEFGDPLRIDAFAVGPGLVGLTICPGRNSTEWNYARNLDHDLDVISKWGASAILTLVEPHELDTMNVRHLGEEAEKRGIRWLHLPIPDLGAPDADGLEAWRQISPSIHQMLDAGGRLLIHCRGGIGRSGLMAAFVLLERGDDLRTAMATVREVRPGAIETLEQERFLARQLSMWNERAEKVRASFFGGAIGDSLGAEIEFWPLDAIARRFPGNVDELLPHAGRIGAITDDTQMTLFTAEGLIDAQNAGAAKDTDAVVRHVHHALLRWFVTQGYPPRIETAERGLVTDPRLHVRRAPGNTCMSALNAAERVGIAATNDSKGCGTIMRVAPVAYARGIDQAQVALSTSALTHGHPVGQTAAAAWACILAEVLAGREPEDAARKAASLFEDETGAAIAKALAAPRNGEAGTVESLGGGWVAEEALAIALYAVLASNSFEQGVSIAVKHSGDSDSTGAIAGNLLGLLYPDEVMAHRWRREIECADLVNRLALEIGR